MGVEVANLSSNAGNLPPPRTVQPARHGIPPGCGGSLVMGASPWRLEILTKAGPGLGTGRAGHRRCSADGNVFYFSFVFSSRPLPFTIQGEQG